MSSKVSALEQSWKKEVNITREIVSKNFAYTWAGIYFTLSLPFNLGTNIKDKLYFGLGTNLSYLVFIHDPDYSLFNKNPTTIPGAHRAFDTNEMKPKSWQYTFEMAEVNKLNLPSSPCNDDPSYNFLSCVRRSVASKVGKKLKFVIRPECFWQNWKIAHDFFLRGKVWQHKTTKSQYRKINDYIHRLLAEFWDLNYIKC